jgi:hypothetical protein
MVMLLRFVSQGRYVRTDACCAQGQNAKDEEEGAVSLGGFNARANALYPT